MKNIIIVTQFVLNTILILILLRNMLGSRSEKDNSIVKTMGNAWRRGWTIILKRKAKKLSVVGGEVVDIKERLEEELTPYEIMKKEKKESERRLVTEMLKKGKDFERIPKRLGIPRGEAELILNLDKVKDLKCETG